MSGGVVLVSNLDLCQPGKILSLENHMLLFSAQLLHNYLPYAHTHICYKFSTLVL